MKTKQNAGHFVKEVMAVIENCEGYELTSEIDNVLNKWEDYFSITPVPQMIADWADNLIDLMNNVEGSGLERELKALRLPGL
jgi:hypothetical protein